MECEILSHEIREPYEQRPRFSTDWLYTLVFFNSGKELRIFEFLIIANLRPVKDSEGACSRTGEPNP